MGRAKVKMELITKEKTRNTTYEKRKNGLIKKVTEFTTLCDVDTAVIIYPPNSKTPEIWPENADLIKKSIASYKAKDENGKRNCGTKEYFEERKKKMDDQLVKARKRNMEARYATWFEELDGLSEGQLRHFAIGLENKENAVRENLESRKRIRFNQQPVINCQYGPGSQILGVDQVMNNLGVGWFDGVAPTTSFGPLGEVDGLSEGQLRDFAMGLENKENAVRENLESRKRIRFDRQPVINYQYGPGSQFLGVDQVMNNHGVGWLDGVAPTASFGPLGEVGGCGYQVFEGGNMVNGNPNPWLCQPRVVQAVMPEYLAMQEFNLQTNNGVGGFVMDDYRGRFMGYN